MNFNFNFGPVPAAGVETIGVGDVAFPFAVEGGDVAFARALTGATACVEGDGTAVGACTAGATGGGKTGGGP